MVVSLLNYIKDREYDSNKILHSETLVNFGESDKGAFLLEHPILGL